MDDPRVALIGNCQANPLARILKFLGPRIQVTRYPVQDLAPRFPAREDLFQELDRYDLVYSLPFGPGLHPELDGLTLRDRLGERFRFYPMVEFNAFHPDCVYIRRRAPAEFVHSPIGDYHSAIALLGFTLGFPIERTLALYAGDVFERLGYFRFWKISEDVLLEQARAIGFPIEAIYRSWVRRSPFMHSLNHPRLFVMADVAATLMRHSGIDGLAHARTVENYFPDETLFDPVWPIYPEIGEAMGIEGAYVFKCGMLPADDRDGLFLSLPEFVERSNAIFCAEKPGNLECSRIDEWMRNEGLIDYLRSR